MKTIYKHSKRNFTQRLLKEIIYSITRIILNALKTNSSDAIRFVLIFIHRVNVTPHHKLDVAKDVPLLQNFRFSTYLSYNLDMTHIQQK